jgi:hypothetical protein
MAGMRPIRSRLTYANVAATLALFLALAGGAAFAADKLAKNSVKAKQIAPNAVGSSEAHDLTLGDFRSGENEKLVGPKGEPGERGPSGERGEQGPPGTPAAVARTVVPVTGQRTMNVASFNVVTVGSFAKAQASTRVDLTYATDLNEQDGCHIQLRVDGANANGQTEVLGSDGFTTPGDIRLGSGFPNRAPAVAFASFTGLPAGQHDVQIAVASGSGATTCTDNGSNMTRAVIVEEVPSLP